MAAQIDNTAKLDSLRMQLQLVENAIKRFKGKTQMRRYDHPEYFKSFIAEGNYAALREKSEEFQNLEYRKEVLVWEITKLTV